MSLKSFLSKLWAGIEYFFNGLPTELQYAAHLAVTVTENIKTVINSPEVDILTAIIPGEIDNEVVSFLRSRLPVILRELRLVNADLSSAAENIQLLNAAAIIQGLKGDTQNSFLHDLGILIVREIARMKEDNLSWSDAVYVIEWYYQNKFKKG